MSDKTFLLIGNNRGDAFWTMVLDSPNEQIIAECAEKMRKNMFLKMLHQKNSGLDIERIGKFSRQYIDNLFKWTEEGRTVLINRSMGASFLDGSALVLKREQRADFPAEDIQIGGGLTGWLSPDGAFHPCDYGSHHKFAASYQGSDRDAFVPFGSNPEDASASHISFDAENLSEKQKEWFVRHFDMFDAGQQKLLQAQKICS